MAYTAEELNRQFEEKKKENTFEEEYMDARQKIKGFIDSIQNGTTGPGNDLYSSVGCLEKLLDNFKGDISRWWDCSPEELYPGSSSYLSSEVRQIYIENRTYLKENISNNIDIWRHLLQEDSYLLKKLIDARKADREARDEKNEKGRKAAAKKSGRIATVSAVLTIVGIVMGIINHTLILPIAGFIIGGILMGIVGRVYYSANYSHCIDYDGTLGITLVIYAPYILITSILVGVFVHIFKVGLFGVLGAIAIFIVGLVIMFRGKK
jgi:hypothetical protein